MEFEILRTEGYPLKIKDKLVYTPGRTGIIGRYPDLLIISLKTSASDPERNFIAINAEGEEVWAFNEGNYLGAKHKFLPPTVDSEGNLWVKNIAGKRYRLDYRTGKVLETQWENVDFEYEGNRLIVGGKEYHLGIEIWKALSFRGQQLMVIYDKEREPKCESRIAAFTKDGEKMWDIGKEVIEDASAMYGLSTEFEDGLYVHAASYHYHIDYKTGKLIYKQFTK